MLGVSLEQEPSAETTNAQAPTGNQHTQNPRRRRHRRRHDVIAHTALAVTITVCATVLAMTNKINPEHVLAAYGLAAAASGAPLVVRRNGGAS